KTSKEEEPIEQRFPRSGDNGLANVVVQLVNRTEADVETMLFRFGLGDDKISFSLLEFPGVLLPAFQPTLAALQQMSKTQDLPFAELLATTQDMPRRDVDTPAYTRLHDFRYDLSTLSSRK
ncbi:NF-X1 finger and helicase domain protein, partial [Venturia nashicola]